MSQKPTNRNTLGTSEAPFAYVKYTNNHRPRTLKPETNITHRTLHQAQAIPLNTRTYSAHFDSWSGTLDPQPLQGQLERTTEFSSSKTVYAQHHSDPSSNLFSYVPSKSNALSSTFGIRPVYPQSSSL
ncbi:hypothetical protein PoB_007517000 [Plakobranchus ocellatus]|uniref:Zasp-like motif domain-containing protein n=1 Tax=Plakobranchus ocellatus TaxID=259542 RepID=A0AAV4DXC6_9GAST|nr:hypothetical protein PoB_007517000 [Plakobranchus ocellatus]